MSNQNLKSNGQRSRSLGMKIKICFSSIPWWKVDRFTSNHDQNDLLDLKFAPPVTDVLGGGHIKCCAPSVCLSVCPVPSTYSKTERHRNFKFLGGIILGTVNWGVKSKGQWIKVKDTRNLNIKIVFEHILVRSRSIYIEPVSRTTLRAPNNRILTPIIVQIVQFSCIRLLVFIQGIVDKWAIFIKWL